MKILTAVALFLAMASFALAGEKKKSEIPSSGCIAGPDELCPSDIELARRAEMKRLEDKYKPPTPTEEDKIRYSGLVQVWNGETPKGYHWNEPKGRWVKNPPAPPQATTPTVPAPAPPAPPAK